MCQLLRYHVHLLQCQVCLLQHNRLSTFNLLLWYRHHPIKTYIHWLFLPRCWKQMLVLKNVGKIIQSPSITYQKKIKVWQLTTTKAAFNNRKPPVTMLNSLLVLSYERAIHHMYMYVAVKLPSTTFSFKYHKSAFLQMLFQNRSNHWQELCS